VAEEFDATQEGSLPERLVFTPYGMLSTKDVILAVLPNGKELLVHGRHLLIAIGWTGRGTKAKVVRIRVRDKDAAHILHEQMDDAEDDAFEGRRASPFEE
jgi:hypothetical protein